MGQNILEFLKKNSKLSSQQIIKADRWAKDNKCTLNFALEKLDLMTPREILSSFSRLYNIKKVVISQITIKQSVVESIPRTVAKKGVLMPIDFSGNHLIVAMADPSNIEVLDSIRFQTGYFCRPIFALESDIRAAFKKYFKSTIEISDLAPPKEVTQAKKLPSSKDRIIVTEGGSAADGPVIKLVNDAILSCLQHNSSDIHLEVYENHLRIRLRTDGMLHEVAKPPLHMKDALISRVKIMSGLDIAETRLPQDGSLKIQTENKEIAFRVSSIPCANGEKIVMRILDNSQLASDIGDLGFEPKQLETFVRMLSYSSGIILVTGPTGSGKTTTLYSALSKLNNEEVNIVTAEDPVEFVLPNINQVAVKPSIGFTFASALRAFLRQDPDIIMVGEIRDLETADIAVKASLTGHVVLSTIHTNSASDTITRLLNMGVASYNLTGALRCIIAQRLLRKLCPHCRRVDKSVDESTLVALGVPKKYARKIKVYNADGCDECGGSGVMGRVAIYEMLEITEDIKTMIVDEEPTSVIKKKAMAMGMKTLRQSAITKMAQGLCSLSEVLRVTDSDQTKSQTMDEANREHTVIKRVS